MTAHATLSVLLGVMRVETVADPRDLYTAVIPCLNSPLHDAIALMKIPLGVNWDTGLIHPVQMTAAHLHDGRAYTVYSMGNVADPLPACI